MDIVRVSFTGRVKDTGKVFDTTYAEAAKKAGIFNEHLSYGPTPMILGENRLIPGLENALSKMKSGEEKTVVVHPKDAFGERDPELVKLVPLKVFKANGINPAPGLVVVLENNLPGRVQSVSGGRVRVDFNHELAGKALEYELKMDERLSDEKEKIRAIFELVFPRIPVKELKIARKEKELELVLPKDCTKLEDLQVRKIGLVKYLKKVVGEDKIQVTEEY
jgi:FKBP-type peptidyl-prolyl cis-trans isomerase 2